MKKILIACLMAGLAALSAQENKGAVKAEQKTASQTEQQAKKDDRNSEKKTVQETTEKKQLKAIRSMMVSFLRIGNLLCFNWEFGKIANY